uniref:Uncharacterized protein n=1 Tax=Rhizophora mucronata TaxID=61149 RepID=A0A2P2PXP8_RHIMU
MYTGCRLTLFFTTQTCDQVPYHYTMACPSFEL